jgi:hypothetical protein
MESSTFAQRKQHHVFTGAAAEAVCFPFPFPPPRPRPVRLSLGACVFSSMPDAIRSRSFVFLGCVSAEGPGDMCAVGKRSQLKTRLFLVDMCVCARANTCVRAFVDACLRVHGARVCAPDSLSSASQGWRPRSSAASIAASSSGVRVGSIFIFRRTFRSARPLEYAFKSSRASFLASSCMQACTCERECESSKRT